MVTGGREAAQEILSNQRPVRGSQDVGQVMRLGEPQGLSRRLEKKTETSLIVHAPQSGSSLFAPLLLVLKSKHLWNLLDRSNSPFDNCSDMEFAECQSACN